MGNSVRSTLGNMCGAEASKDPHYDEDQRPVKKPKEEKLPKESKKQKKKKDKKNKKDQSSGNGALTQIEEGDEPKTIAAAPNTGGEEKSPLSDQTQKNGEPPKNEEPSKYEEPEQGSTTSFEKVSRTLKEQASVNDLIGTVDAVDDKSDYDNNEAYDEEEDEDELKFIEDEGKTSSGDIHKTIDNDSNDGGQRSGSDSRASGMVSRNSDNNQNLPLYTSVTPIVPEELKISCADNIFEGCAEKYQIFVDKNHEFQNAVNCFQEQVLPDQNNPDWDNVVRAYKEHLENENKREGGENADSGQVDISDMNASVQSIRAQAQQLSATINSVRPPVKRYLSEAADVDVIEYVKGKMVEGEQLGITSKFSAPGKYRRNMKQLKKALSTLDGVKEEVREIQRSLDVDSDVRSNGRLSPLQDNESAIVPITNSGPEHDTEEDIFARLQELDPPQHDDVHSHPKLSKPPKTDGKEGTYERKLLSQPKENPEEDKLKTLLEQSGEFKRSQSPGTTTYVIETIPENSNNKKVLGPSDRQPPKIGAAPGQPKNPVKQVIVEEEEHNTLDFGKYVLVDPNTGDIQVMRNRSRSLDSLVSMTSNRSSLSRFGSFEFVTDFEINIAEKNQQQV